MGSISTRVRTHWPRGKNVQGGNAANKDSYGFESLQQTPVACKHVGPGPNNLLKILKREEVTTIKRKRGLDASEEGTEGPQFPPCMSKNPALEMGGTGKPPKIGGLVGTTG